MRYSRPLFLVIILLVIFDLQAQTVNYISPKPGSEYNNENTSIIIGYRNSSKVNTSKPHNLEVKGSLSGIHSGKIISVQGNRVIFRPDKPFALGEKVTVKGIENTEGFSFNIRNSRVNSKFNIEDEIGFVNRERNISNFDHITDSLPQFAIFQNGPTADGYLFLINYEWSGPAVPSYLMILKNTGEPVFSRSLPGIGRDFKKQQNNLLTYYDDTKSIFLGLDYNYTVVDSFYCGNGYSTDTHELQVMPDGSAWVMGYDPEIIDMSHIVPGGDPHAIVTGLIIQKIDTDKNVIFQWRSWDYIPITDATHENLTAATIDYIHGNAIEVCPDGNIMISGRHTDEITKINTATGDIIWRLGGKENQFTFLNDPIGFSHQHSIRRISEKNIILFDNGNYHSPPFSRAVEYSLDENNNTATLIWQFRHSPDIITSAMGSVQRFSNGNTLIGWGSAFTAALTEVTPEGTVVYELSLPPGEVSYRAFRFGLDNLTYAGKNNNIPDYYDLKQNYPNPFNPVTNIKFDIPKSTYTNLSIYDITGRKIDEIIDKFLSKGEYTQKWDGTNFSSGIYFYKLTTDDFSSTKKMVLIK